MKKKIGAFFQWTAIASLIALVLIGIGYTLLRLLLPSLTVKSVETLRG